MSTLPFNISSSRAAPSAFSQKHTAPPPIPPRTYLLKRADQATSTGDTFQRAEQHTANGASASTPSATATEDATQTLLKQYFPKDPKATSKMLKSQIHESGDLGYALWGHKPMVLMSGPSWTALKAVLDKGAATQDNFTLIDSPSSGRLSSGFIINKENLRTLLTKHPEAIASLQTSPPTSPEDLVRHFTEQSPLAKALLNDQQTMGALLGYGPTNAAKWGQLYGGKEPALSVESWEKILQAYNQTEQDGSPNLKRAQEVYTQEENTFLNALETEFDHPWILPTAHEIVNEDNNYNYKVKMPVFKCSDQSPETVTLVTRYLEDSWRIRDFLEAQFKAHASQSYSSFVGELVLKTLFKV